MGKIKYFINWNFSNITFNTCGLDIGRNFMQAPICDCGCNGKLNVILEDDEDVVSFCGEMCYENDCDQCAVFAITDRNVLIAAIKYGDEIRIVRSDGVLNNYKVIGELADELELHCYGLIKWKHGYSYEIVEE